MTDDDGKLKQRIEWQKDNLDRTINWINSCDSKTGIVLASVGVVISLFLSGDGLNHIYTIYFKLSEECGCLYKIAVVLLIIAVIFISAGIICLLSSLIARIDLSKYVDKQKLNKSEIFFGSISKFKCEDEFEKSFYDLNEETILSELTTQTYVNSIIANKKFALFNKGLVLTCLGAAIILMVYLFG